MDAENRTFEAVGVREGKIVSVGTRETVAASLKPGFDEIDLQGRTMLPGFYAAHDHFPEVGENELLSVDLNSPELGPIHDIEELIAALKRKADATPPGEWVLGWGYDDTLLRELRHPTRGDLDRVSTRHPIWITHISGHLGVANSKALEIAGVTKATPQPAGGRIRLDATTGEPNGVFEEATGLVGRHIPPPTDSQRLKAIRLAQKAYLAQGVTTTVIAGASAVTLADIDSVISTGGLQLRISGLVARRDAGKVAAFQSTADQLHLTGVKLLQDGSLQGYTGYLSKPYHKQPEGRQGFRGYASRPREELVKMVVDYHKQGLQIAIHGNGDAAIDDIIAAFAEAQKTDPRPDARHRIEHCQTVREDQLARMEELGITPSFFQVHVYYWGDRHRDIFLGPERAARISPLASAAASQDADQHPQRHFCDSRQSAHAGVVGGEPDHLQWQTLGPDECISVTEALRCVTIDAAWQAFEEKSRGSIEPGKLADFVILDRNPLITPPGELRDLKVVETIIGGNRVYVP